MSIWSEYLSSFSISFSHHGHICHCNHNSLQPSLSYKYSYNFRLGVVGCMGDNFSQRLLSNKKQIWHWHSHCDEEIEVEGKRNIKSLSTHELFLANSTHLSGNHSSSRFFACPVSLWLLSESTLANHLSHFWDSMHFFDTSNYQNVYMLCIFRFRLFAVDYLF